jgi:periplasmic divalent cation tolerance protein
MSDYCLVYVTTSDKAEAVRLGRHAVERRLAACANVIPAMRAIYWWKGELQTSDEAVLVLKTRAALAGPLTQAIAELHSYECPCIVAFPIVEGHVPYLEWVAEETRSPGAEGPTA